MTKEEILAGESINLEFKEQRPGKSKNYMKTVVAFANGKGGRIVFGVEDGTRKIVGIPEDDVFSEMDAIANAISDNCMPTIIPDIYPQTIDGKTIIILEIAQGKQRPYCIKSEGGFDGVYVRVSGTTRKADPMRAREMFYESEGRSYDSVARHDIGVTDEDIQKLCDEMKGVALDNCKSETQKKALVGCDQEPSPKLGYPSGGGWRNPAYQRICVHAWAGWLQILNPVRRVQGC